MGANVVKIKHIQDCPICHHELRRDDANSLSGTPFPSGTQNPFHVFICTSPLANNPLHYYTHTVIADDPDWIITQEFCVDLGNRYVLFKNDYKQETSTVKSSRDIQALQVPVLLIPDFPTLESLKKKIRMSITFS